LHGFSDSFALVSIPVPCAIHRQVRQNIPLAFDKFNAMN